MLHDTPSFPASSWIHALYVHHPDFTLVIPNALYSFLPDLSWEENILYVNRGSVWDWVPLQIGADLSEKSCFKLLEERKGLTSDVRHLPSLVTVISENASMTVGGEFGCYKSATLTLVTGALRHRKCKWCSWGCSGTSSGYRDFMYQDHRSSPLIIAADLVVSISCPVPSCWSVWSVPCIAAANSSGLSSAWRNISELSGNHCCILSI